MRVKMLQWRTELGDEWMMGETVKPLGEQGIKMLWVDKIKRTAEKPSWLHNHSDCVISKSPVS
jgi:hypothetical protein